MRRRGTAHTQRPVRSASTSIVCSTPGATRWTTISPSSWPRRATSASRPRRAPNRRRWRPEAGLGHERERPGVGVGQGTGGRRLLDGGKPWHRASRACAACRRRWRRRPRATGRSWCRSRRSGRGGRPTPASRCRSWGRRDRRGASREARAGANSGRRAAARGTPRRRRGRRWSTRSSPWRGPGRGRPRWPQRPAEPAQQLDAPTRRRDEDGDRPAGPHGSGRRPAPTKRPGRRQDPGTRGGWRGRRRCPRRITPVTVSRMMRRSRRSERCSTYQTSRSSWSSQDSALRPLTCAQPVTPGRTSWRRAWSGE